MTAVVRTPTIAMARADRSAENNTLYAQRDDRSAWDERIQSTMDCHDLTASATAEQLLRRRNELRPGDPVRASVRARVIAENLPMARRIARRYAGRGEPLDDLIQVAALALVKAVDGYDTSRDTLFVSYAIPSITGALKRHFRDHAWGMRVPRGMQELVLLVRDTSGELAHRLGRPATPAELAQHLDITADRLLAATRPHSRTARCPWTSRRPATTASARPTSHEPSATPTRATTPSTTASHSGPWWLPCPNGTAAS